MTGKDFVELCHTEKESILESYFRKMVNLRLQR